MRTRGGWRKRVPEWVGRVSGRGRKDKRSVPWYLGVEEGLIGEGEGRNLVGATKGDSGWGRRDGQKKAELPKWD